MRIPVSPKDGKIASMSGEELDYLTSTENVYVVMLNNGLSVLGKSHDTDESIQEQGGINMLHCMKAKTNLVQNQNGEISEMMTISPWIEAAPIEKIHFIPIDTFIVASPCSPHIAKVYAARVLNQAIKEAAFEMLDKIHESQPEGDLPVLDFSELDNPGYKDSSEEKKETPFLAPPQEPRQPEMLDPKLLMEAVMSGDIEEPEDDDEEYQNVPWKKNGRTIN